MMIITQNGIVFHRLYTIVVEKVLISVDKWLIKCILELYEGFEKCNK